MAFMTSLYSILYKYFDLIFVAIINIQMLKTSVLVLFFVCLTFQGELTAEVGGGFAIYSDQPIRNVLAKAALYKASLDPLNN